MDRGRVVRGVPCTFRAPGDAEIWAHTPLAPLFSPTGVQTVGAALRGWTSAPSVAGPPKPRPRYLAACSARSVSRAKWSVPKKSTRQGGFSRTRGPRPSSPPGDPPSQASARHPGLGLRPAPPPAGRGPHQRRTSTHISFAGWPTSRRRVGVRVPEPGPRGGPGEEPPRGGVCQRMGAETVRFGAWPSCWS